MDPIRKILIDHGWLIRREYTDDPMVMGDMLIITDPLTNKDVSFLQAIELQEERNPGTLSLYSKYIDSLR